MLLRFPDGLCRQQVKLSIIAGHKRIYAILRDAHLYRGGQGGKDVVRSVPMTNEKAGTHFVLYLGQFFSANMPIKSVAFIGY